MTWSFSIGRLFGSEIRVHVTFFLLLGWIALAAYSEQGWPAAVENTVFVLALFACVLAHEFGHALVARRYGIRTPDITLLPIGGLARLESIPKNPWHEMAVAVAGPLVNVAIWLLLALLGLAPAAGLFSGLAPAAGGFSVESFLQRLAAVNLILAVFNMIPAFPMDGGRVLRAALSLGMDRVKATRAASLAGQMVALLLAFAGLSWGNPLLVLIAGFVFIAANAENQEVALQSVARRMLARDAMITSYESLAPTDTLDAAAAAVVRTTQHEFPVAGLDGKPLGFVTRGRLFSALAAQSPRTQPVAEVMQTDFPQVQLTAGLEDVLDALHKAPAVAVCTADGRLAGYINRENIGELMVIRGR